MSGDKCQACGGEPVPHHPFCAACEDAFLARGVCKRCGVEPRKPKYRGNKQSQYCRACAVAAMNFVLSRNTERDVVRPKYRGPDAREDVRETRGGG